MADRKFSYSQPGPSGAANPEEELTTGLSSLSLSSREFIHQGNFNSRGEIISQEESFASNKIFATNHNNAVIQELLDLSATGILRNIFFFCNSKGTSKRKIRNFLLTLAREPRDDFRVICFIEFNKLAIFDEIKNPYFRFMIAIANLSSTNASSLISMACNLTELNHSLPESVKFYVIGEPDIDEIYRRFQIHYPGRMLGINVSVDSFIFELIKERRLLSIFNTFHLKILQKITRPVATFTELDNNFRSNAGNFIAEYPYSRRALELKHRAFLRGFSYDDIPEFTDMQQGVLNHLEQWNLTITDYAFMRVTGEDKLRKFLTKPDQPFPGRLEKTVLIDPSLPLFNNMNPTDLNIFLNLHELGMSLTVENLSIDCRTSANCQEIFPFITYGVIFVDGDNIFSYNLRLVEFLINCNTHFNIIIYANINTIARYSNMVNYLGPLVTLKPAYSTVSNATDIALSMGVTTLDFLVAQDIPFYVFTDDNFVNGLIGTIKSFEGRQIEVISYDPNSRNGGIYFQDFMERHYPGCQPTASIYLQDSLADEEY